MEQLLNPMHLDDRHLALPPFSQQVEKIIWKRRLFLLVKVTGNSSHLQPSQLGKHRCDANTWADVSSSGETPFRGVNMPHVLGVLWQRFDFFLFIFPLELRKKH